MIKGFISLERKYCSDCGFKKRDDSKDFCEKCGIVDEEKEMFRQFQ